MRSLKGTSSSAASCKTRLLNESQLISLKMIFLFCKQTDFVDEWGEFKGLSLNVAKNHIKFLQKKLLIIGGFHPFNNAGS